MRHLQEKSDSVVLMATLNYGIFLAEVSEDDWSKRPESVKRPTQRLIDRMTELEGGNEGLTEQVNRNSQNSSQPPSQVVEPVAKKKPKPKVKQKRGAQVGHEGHHYKIALQANAGKCHRCGRCQRFFVESQESKIS